jgi:hypothetical protein
MATLDPDITPPRLRVTEDERTSIGARDRFRRVFRAACNRIEAHILERPGTQWPGHFLQEVAQAEQEYHAALLELQK